MKAFDIAPFALPPGQPGETRFEEPRDIERVVVRFRKPPQRLTCSYLRKIWPHNRFERASDADLLKPGAFGWASIDDGFNAKWHKASIQYHAIGDRDFEITFRGVHREFKEFPDRENYNVTYRRALGIKVCGSAGAIPSRTQVFTRSEPVRTTLFVELDAGRVTPGRELVLTGYNARVGRVSAGQGVNVQGKTVSMPRGRRRRSFRVTIDHMAPAFRYCHDDALLMLDLGKDLFTVSLESIRLQGPVWYEEKGIYIRRLDDSRDFAQYCRENEDACTVATEVVRQGDQSLSAAIRGQPRPHALGFVFGCRHCREMFLVRANGDMVLPHWPICLVPGSERERFRNGGDGRFCFGLEEWIPTARFHDPFPVQSYNIHVRREGIALQQKCFAVPLMHSMARKDPKPDALLVAMIRFRFENVGARPETATLTMAYSDRSSRWLASAKPHAPLDVRSGWIRSTWEGGKVIRGQLETTMTMRRRSETEVVFSKRLKPGERCEIVMRVPYVALESKAEKQKLVGLKFDRSYREMAASWRRQPVGAPIETPEPRLNEAYAGHVPAVYTADAGMHDAPELVNTSVGMALYMNYPNESCMILEDLDQRGLHDEVRRRLAVWLKFQGTAYLMGRFTDFDGLLFGAGGVQQGESYNQHHGWVLWSLSEHFFITRDETWFHSVAGALIDGVEWVLRQIRETRKPQPYSRGWEHGFMPAGALEDVDDYFYWLSTNCLTWRGVDHAARALAAIGHPDAARLQKEANRFRRDLIRGYEMSRKVSPLIRLRDGRWIPHYPSRLYRRGRDYGWIREVLEGSIYLVLSGLYSPHSKQAQWILDDFQDTRYMNPPYGFPVVWNGGVPPELFTEIRDPVGEWYHQGGFSFQPNLLAGLLPYLERDEIEVYLWMFFNAWAACYREEIGSIAEHPLPVLGYSNYAPAKTSDQSNAMKWLRYIFVYAPSDTLYIGRAIPRAWLGCGEPIGMRDVATRHGQVSVRYTRNERKNTLRAELKLKLRPTAGRTVLRFRHPEGEHVKRVQINGRACRLFDARKGDVDLTGCNGRVVVEASY